MNNYSTMEKIYGAWKNDEDGNGDYFVATSGEIFVYRGTDEENNETYFRSTLSGDLIKQDDLLTG